LTHRAPIAEEAEPPADCRLRVVNFEQRHVTARATKPYCVIQVTPGVMELVQLSTLSLSPRQGFFRSAGLRSRALVREHHHRHQDGRRDYKQSRRSRSENTGLRGSYVNSAPTPDEILI
jgi:hypothetical protein